MCPRTWPLMRTLSSEILDFVSQIEDSPNSYRDEADKEPKAYKGNDFVTDVNANICVKSIMKR